MGNTVDFDLGETGGETAAGSGLDLELEADAAGAASAGATSLDLDLTEGADRAPDSLAEATPERAPGGQTSEAGGDDSDAGVDTEFRNIFPGDTAEDEASSGRESALDFDLGSTDTTGASPDDDDMSAGGATEFMLSDDLAAGDEDEDSLALGSGASGQVDEMQTKLDLAQAYVDMGDSEGARNLLGEVMAEGSEAQQGEAREMLQKLS